MGNSCSATMPPQLCAEFSSMGDYFKLLLNLGQRSDRESKGLVGELIAPQIHLPNLLFPCGGGHGNAEAMYSMKVVEVGMEQFCRLSGRILSSLDCQRTILCQNHFLGTEVTAWA